MGVEWIQVFKWKILTYEQKPEGSEQVTDLCSNKTGVVEQMKPGEKLETIKYESLGP